MYRYPCILIYFSGDVRQFAIVTNIDKIGVHTLDMENIFKYKSVKEICAEVAEFLEIEITSVHPVSNYNEEITPSVAKNVLSLMTLWDIVDCGNKYIQQKFEKSDFFGDDY